MQIVWNQLHAASLFSILIVLGPCSFGQSAPVLQAQNWVRTGDMNVSRSMHTATLLANGKVLVAGGLSGSGVLDSAELFDPAAGAWSITGKMNAPRLQHSATLLSDGRVLVVGGIDRGGWFYEPYILEEIYDPASGEWVAGGGQTHTKSDGYRSSHTATLLDSGGVFIAGGWDFGANDTHANSLLYDPPARAPQMIDGPPNGRAGHQSNLLPDGRILFTGGWVWDGARFNYFPTASALAFGTGTRTWKAVGASTQARAQHTATLLPNGTVLVVGGGNIDAELFEPASDGWTSAGRPSTDRSGHTASLLRNGSVLVAGGAPQGGDVINSVELYDPSSGRWESARSLNDARSRHTATALSDGRVLVTGGDSNNNAGGAFAHLRSAEIFRYRLATPAFTVVEYVNTQDFADSPGGHYFYTDDPAELTQLDTGHAGNFVRSGREFKSGGSKPLCRFFGSVTPGPNSHFYTISDAECANLKALQAFPAPRDVQQWNYEGQSFAQEPPVIDGAGTNCPMGTLPVYRGYNNAYTSAGQKNPWDSAHRHSTNHADIQQMVTLFGWRDEGIVFCSAQ